MKLGLAHLMEWLDGVAPIGAPRRKILQILSIILVVEGISVIFMFSYVWAGLGLVSILLGSSLLFLLHCQSIPSENKVNEPPGILFIEQLVSFIGGAYVVMATGVGIIVLVVSYDHLVSDSPGFGDVDTLSLFFGGLLVAYPFLVNRFRVEMTFALIFVGLVVLLLVVPLVVTSLAEGDGESSTGGWYVRYMLAAPFSAILDLIGIPSSSSGSIVTIEFNDGTIHSLAISTYCAGIYSFSIFLSAFFSFVVVFERLKPRVLVMVLSLGLLIAYLGNLFRMVVIGVVGYYRGLDDLLWAHENVGWLIFLSWSAIFWFLVLRYLSHDQGPVDSGTEVN